VQAIPLSLIFRLVASSSWHLQLPQNHLHPSTIREGRLGFPSSGEQFSNSYTNLGPSSLSASYEKSPMASTLTNLRPRSPKSYGGTLPCHFFYQVQKCFYPRYTPLGLTYSNSGRKCNLLPESPAAYILRKVIQNLKPTLCTIDKPCR
jgi:hypothetical protein